MRVSPCLMAAGRAVSRGLWVAVSQENLESQARGVLSAVLKPQQAMPASLARKRAEVTASEPVE